jgi:hypothetical protein
MTYVGYCSRTVMMDVLLFFNLAATLENTYFRFLSPAVRWNRLGAANMLLLFILHQYIGVANHLAPILELQI